MMIKLRLSIGVFMGLILVESVSTVDYINKGDTCSVLQALEDKSAEVQFLKRQIQALQDQLRRRKDVLGRIRGLELKTNRVDAMLKSVQAQLGAFTGGAGPKGSGAVYVRWGRTVCPGDSTLIYDGFAGGSFVTYGGGGSNYVCLPRDPEWGKTVEGRQDCISLMFGAEYQSCAGNDHLFSKENADSGALYDEDVPCAVCQASGRQSHVMIPAKINCPDGWLREYFGYLMSSHYEHKRTEWVCVDPAPEVILKGSENTNGALFYFTEVACGSLPCPPYRDGEELTCVVCTK